MKHRVGPADIFSDGAEEWFLNNKLHRTDGPAVYPRIPTMVFTWKTSPKDGPAVIYPDGYEEWFLMVKNTEEQHEQEMERRNNVSTLGV